MKHIYCAASFHNHMMLPQCRDILVESIINNNEFSDVDDVHQITVYAGGSLHNIAIIGWRDPNAMTPMVMVLVPLADFGIELHVHSMISVHFGRIFNKEELNIISHMIRI